MPESFPPSNLLGVLRAFLDSVSSLNPQYCLIGGVALGMWGRPRATQDIDFLLLFEDTTKLLIVQALESHGFIYDRMWAESNPMLHGVITRFLLEKVPIDIINSRNRHEEEAISRKTLIDLEEFSVWVASPEDLVLLKLKASRPQDFEDVMSIIVRQ